MLFPLFVCSFQPLRWRQEIGNGDGALLLDLADVLLLNLADFLLTFLDLGFFFGGASPRRRGVDGGRRLCRSLHTWSLSLQARR